MPPRFGSITQAAGKAGKDLESREAMTGMGGPGLREPVARKHQQIVEGAVRAAAEGAKMTHAEIRKAVDLALAKTAKPGKSNWTPLGMEVKDSLRENGAASAGRTWARGVGKEFTDSFRSR